MRTKCLNCSGINIVTDIRAVDKGDGKRDLKLEVYENPDATLFKGVHDASLKADVCKDCGHVMLYVSVDKAAEFSVHKDANKSIE